MVSELTWPEIDALLRGQGSNGWIDAGVFSKACMKFVCFIRNVMRIHHYAVCVGNFDHPLPDRGKDFDILFADVASALSEATSMKPPLAVQGDHFAMTGSPDEGYYVGNIPGVPRPLHY